MSEGLQKHGDVEELISRNISVDTDGIVTITDTETLSSAGGTAANAYVDSDWNCIGDSHADETYCLCVSVSLQDEGAIKKLTKVYKGIKTATKRFYLTVTGAQEPIQTHPAFKDSADAEGYDTTLAGTGASPENEAVFKGTEENSEFDYFPPNAPNDLGGVTSYLEPAVELQAVIVQKNSDMEDPTWELDDALYNVADITDPPDGAPSIGNVRTWLVMGSTQEVIGGAIKITVSYRMSGAKGWNTAIYNET